MRAPRLSPHGSAARGFSLVELLVAMFLLSIAMLGILAIFDASNRINKSEQDIADAQGHVRFGVYQMTSAIRMAGAGGLFLTQAVLSRPDPDLPGINGIACSDSTCQGYDNVPTGVTVTSLTGPVKVRPGTDMIEVRGVLFSPLLSFDLSLGCGGCTGPASDVKTAKVTSPPKLPEDDQTEQHVNDDPTRPQFAAIDAYTSGVAPGKEMFVIVSANDDIHGGCSAPFGAQEFPQPSYNVGLLSAPTQLGSSNTFGAVNFTDNKAREFNNENPVDAGADPVAISNVRRGGILDDVIFFIDDTDPNHPALARGIRRGVAFDVTTFADDVEDMQISYGVDFLPPAGAGQPLRGDGRVTRQAAVTARDTDLNTSNQAGGDEWQPNVAGETPWSTIAFQADPAPGTFQHPGLPASVHCPRLHGVMIALVARSKDPDPTYKGPSGFGLVTMNAPTPTPGPGPTTYHRRVQILRINLRNYAVAE
jgi:prepilin-type N-terminal cleavage/methylation domain-containing protein